MKTLKLMLPMLLLTACQAPMTRSLTPAAPMRPMTMQRAQNVVARGLLKSEFKYSADKTELTVIMVHDTGETIKAVTTRNPLTGSAVKAETITERNGAVVQRRATTPAEADLTVKVCANNGWQDVYRDLKARYQLAGLIS